MRSGLVLASASPRRLELLRQIGIEPVVHPVDVDERLQPGERPGDLVLRLADAKAAACVLERRKLGETRLPVLAADTVVVVDEEVLGKPADGAQAVDWMMRMSGHWHEVLSAVSLHDGECLHQRICVSRVRFREISRAEAEAYWAGGEPADKAGGYAIQGLGAVFVERLEGSYSGVVGLPLAETAALLAEVGIRVVCV